MISTKIAEHHLQKPAYVYVRQSSLAQVRFHQESTERQYALRNKAIELGWRESQIRTLDGDLGLSGAQTTGREDFKALVTDVSMGNDTSASTSSGAMPWASVSTVTVGAVRSGKTSTGMRHAV